MRSRKGLRACRSLRPRRREVARLIDIMAALRTPGTGCPWDLEQTFATIAPYTIEEAYEVADAIARGHMGDLEEELGDLLLQVVYHARMAEEQGAFTFADVANGSRAKRWSAGIRTCSARPRQRAAGAAKGFWEKRQGRGEAAREAARVQGAAIPPERLLDACSRWLPALTRAVKLQGKAAKVGFDWPSLAPVFDKMKEELAELEDVHCQRRSREHRGGVRRPAVRSRQCGAPPRHRSRGRACAPPTRSSCAASAISRSSCVERGSVAGAIDLERNGCVCGTRPRPRAIRRPSA